MEETLHRSTQHEEDFEIPDNLPIHELDIPVTRSELDSALKKANNGKAFGPDLTIMEYIKYAPNSTKNILLALINFILHTLCTPNQTSDVLFI